VPRFSRRELNHAISSRRSRALKKGLSVSLRSQASDCGSTMTHSVTTSDRALEPARSYLAPNALAGSIRPWIDEASHAWNIQKLLWREPEEPLGIGIAVDGKIE
jgi:hypothetical protein